LDDYFTGTATLVVPQAKYMLPSANAIEKASTAPPRLTGAVTRKTSLAFLYPKAPQTSKS
jgi:hypothetical protein